MTDAGEPPRPLRDPTERYSGRTHEPEPWRSPAQVDTDRVFYSPEFRRLSGVTQVVPPQDGYQFHDRLSHSIKVAQVAASLARRLVADRGSIPPTIDVEEWVRPDYCYVAGLVHDLGHPPFGHAGEYALQALLADIELPDDDSTPDDYSPGFRSFEGNAQSTRIATRLSFRKEQTDQPGLDLTLRSIAAIAKYPWLKGEHPHSVVKLAAKWSFFPEEAALRERLEIGGFILTERAVDAESGQQVVERVWRWPEAEVMDWSDDITYAVHDLEDFFRAGMIPLARIHHAIVRAPKTVDWATTDFDFVEDDEIRVCFTFIQAKIRKLVLPTGEAPTAREVAFAWRQIHDLVVPHIPATPFNGSRRSHAELQKFGSTLITILIESTSLTYHDEVQRVQLRIEPSAVVIAEIFKALNNFFVIENSTLAVMQFGQSEDLGYLFDALLELSRSWLEGVKRNPHGQRLPARLREYIRENVDEITNPELRLNRVQIAVIDYICSLRDAQAMDLASRLRGARHAMSLSGRWLDS